MLGDVAEELSGAGERVAPRASATSMLYGVAADAALAAAVEPIVSVDDQAVVVGLVAVVHRRVPVGR